MKHSGHMILLATIMICIGTGMYGCTKPKSEPKVRRGVIRNIDLDKMQVTISHIDPRSGQKRHDTGVVTADTVLTINGKPADFTQAREGDMVEFQAAIIDGVPTVLQADIKRSAPVDMSDSDSTGGMGDDEADKAKLPTATTQPAT